MLCTSSASRERDRRAADSGIDREVDAVEVLLHGGA
jgi:hypothetical protein